MININGKITTNQEANFSIDNRGYKYGDALFETLKVVNGKIFFWEDHYFRLMASMRIMRMNIPKTFTLEVLENEIIKTVEANGLANESARVRLNVDRGIDCNNLTLQNVTIKCSLVGGGHIYPFYSINDNNSCIVDLYKDFYMSPGLLSGLKSNNKSLQVIGSIYAKENDLDNCLVLNTNKNVIEALNGNLFLVIDKYIKTPPLEDGCLKGVMRKQILQLLAKDPNIEIEEKSISPFELQKADELFITNVIQGIVPITQYRKKTYTNDFSKTTLTKLNAAIRLVN